MYIIMTSVPLYSLDAFFSRLFFVRRAFRWIYSFGSLPGWLRKRENPRTGVLESQELLFWFEGTRRS